MDACNSTVYTANKKYKKENPEQERFSVVLIDYSTSICDNLVFDYIWKAEVRKGYGFCGTMDSVMELTGTPEFIEEKKETKDTDKRELEIPDELLDMSEEELRKMIDEYVKEYINEELGDDRLFEHVKKVVDKSKPQRIVINLPGWLKERLKQKSTKKGISMNAVMRLALTEYLAKDE